MPLNLPNLLTWQRILAIPLLVAVYLLPWEGWSLHSRNLVATVIFVLAAVTDWVDGYLARRLGQQTAFGAFLDPVADKLLVCVALVMLLELLEMLEVADCRDRRPHEMSGGQQQRVAIAVALAGDPSVLLADEPTGELDSHTGEQIFAAFRTANERLGTTVVIVTHDQAVANEVSRTVAIRDGRTSTEVLRRSEVDEATGHEKVVAREYAMLDRAGRLQLPAEYTSALGMRDRVALELEPDHIAVRPDDSGREEG